MHRFILILSVLGLLILTACGASLQVKNSTGRVVGAIEVLGTKSATLVNSRGETLGKVRGTVVRDSSGKNIGTIAERDGIMVILDGKNNAVGSVSKNNECFGKGQDVLGSITGEVDPEVAAGACLTFFLQ